MSFVDILDFLFPKRCVGCGKWGDYLCLGCVSELRLVERPLCPICQRMAVDGMVHPRCRTKWGVDGLVTALLFTSVVKKFIHQFKYRMVYDLVRCAVELVAKHTLSVWQIERLAKEGYLLVPIPLHKEREKWRGFNQAVLFGRGIGKKWQLGIEENILIRTRKTFPQAELPGHARMANVAGAFAIAGNANIMGKNILLVDDLFTTGSTIKECARVLKKNGAASVWALTLARTAKIGES